MKIAMVGDESSIGNTTKLTAIELHRFGIDAQSIDFGVFNSQAIEKYDAVIVNAKDILNISLFLSRVIDNSSLKFIVWNHLDVGPLAVVPEGVEVLMQLIHSQVGHSNLEIAATSQNMANWISLLAPRKALYLPILVDTSRCIPSNSFQRGTISIGVLGRQNTLKNLFTGVAAARAYYCRSASKAVYIFVQEPEDESQNKNLEALKAVWNGITVVPKMSHQDFTNRFLPSLDLIISLSYAEAFNRTVAEGYVAGVPAIVSNTMYWVPLGCQVAHDDIQHIVYLIGEMETRWANAVEQGRMALQGYNRVSLLAWKNNLK